MIQNIINVTTCVEISHMGILKGTGQTLIQSPKGKLHMDCFISNYKEGLNM